MERRIFDALRESGCARPARKEVREALAFCNAVKGSFTDVKVILDVAGGHGALAALFLALHRPVERAIVIDPFEVRAGKDGVRKVFGQFVDTESLPRYRHERLQTALPDEIRKLLGEHNQGPKSQRSTEAEEAGARIFKEASTSSTDPELTGKGEGDEHRELAFSTKLTGGGPGDEQVASTTTSSTSTTSSTTKVYKPQEILVVACHACQHLTEETIEIAQSFGVHVAVMPCCHSDRTQGARWKATAGALWQKLMEKDENLRSITAIKASSEEEATTKTSSGEVSARCPEEVGVVETISKTSQKRPSTSKSQKNSKGGSFFPAVSDLLTLGRMEMRGSEAGVLYETRMKFVAEDITPQNRILIGISRPIPTPRETGRGGGDKLHHLRRRADIRLGKLGELAGIREGTSSDINDTYDGEVDEGDVKSCYAAPDEGNSSHSIKSTKRNEAEARLENAYRAAHRAPKTKAGGA
ncbi:unnamed protein product [Amoebophrya sp. A25]|nr:unnamed protein product [Amoebophrya sp. A25]|eukprot:GSA25T00012077001.1